MRKCIALLMILAIAMMGVAAGDKDTPAELEVSFDSKKATGGDNAHVEFGFSEVAVSEPYGFVQVPTGNVFALEDNDDDPFTLIGENPKPLYIYWKISSSDAFKISISSEAMSHDAAAEGETLDFTLSTSAFEGTTLKGNAGGVILDKDNEYGAKDGSPVYVYTHGSTPVVVGSAPISFVTEDAAKKTPGDWSATVTLTYTSVGSGSGS